MTQSTCTQKVTVIIFLIIFVSSISPVVAPKRKEHSEVGQPSSSSNDPSPDQRSLTVTVHVVLPKRVRFAPDAISVTLMPDDLGITPREIKMSWTYFHENKCMFEFSPDPEFFATEGYSLAVAVVQNSGNHLKNVGLESKIRIKKNEAVYKEIKYDISGEKPQATLR